MKLGYSAGDNGSLAPSLREIRDLDGGNGIVGQQYRDSVLDPIHRIAIAGEQALANRLSLRTAVGAPQTPLGDSAIDRGKGERIKQLQRLMRGGAAQDVEQSFVHAFSGIESGGILYSFPGIYNTYLRGWAI